MKLHTVRFRVQGLNVIYALNKLIREGVEVQNIRLKDKRTLLFTVNAEYERKVFAIFDGSCYNIGKIGIQGAIRPLLFFKRRVGVAIGLAVFFLAALSCNLFVLRVEVFGSGSYYRREVLQILRANGISAFSRYDDLGSDSAKLAILNLEGVSFCELSRSGTVLSVEVEVSSPPPVIIEVGKKLYAPASGKIESFSVVVGTAYVKAGDEVKEGDLLAEGVTLSGEEEVKVPSPLVARGLLRVPFRYEYAAIEDSESERKNALAAAKLYCGDCEVDLLQIECVIGENGVVYQVAIEYLMPLSTN